MTDLVDVFFAEIRSAPKFVEASSIDPAWVYRCSDFERKIHEIFRRCGDGPEWIELGNDVLAVIRRRDMSLKEKLLGIVELLTAVRNNSRTVN